MYNTFIKIYNAQQVRSSIKKQICDRFEIYDLVTMSQNYTPFPNESNDYELQYYTEDD